MNTLNTLAAVNFDPIGFVQLRVLDSTTIGASGRRVNRVPTLDGGVAVNDQGFSEGDRTIELRWQPADAALEDNVRRMVEVYPTVHVATRAGVFLAIPETYEPGAEESTLRLLVISKTSI
jgi:hypothetical protein